MLGRDPGEPSALHLLCMLLYQAGRNDGALTLLRYSVEPAPSTARFHSNLAGVPGRPRSCPTCARRCGKHQLTTSCQPFT